MLQLNNKIYSAIKHTISIFVISFITLSLTNCSNINPHNSQLNNNTNSTINKNSSSTQTDIDKNDIKSIPPVTIASPAVLPIETGSILVFQSSMNGDTPNIGNPGAIRQEFSNNDHLIAISILDITINKSLLNIARFQKSQPQTMLAKIWNKVIDFAHAFTFGNDELDSENTAASSSNVDDAENDDDNETNREDLSADICAQDSITCCPINDDGSFECYPTDQGNTYNIYVFNKFDGTAIGKVTKQKQEHLLWLRKSPIDLAATNKMGISYALTDGIGVKAMHDSTGVLRVTGAHNSNYINQAFNATDVTQLAFGNANGTDYLDLAIGGNNPRVSLNSVIAPTQGAGWDPSNGDFEGEVGEQQISDTRKYIIKETSNGELRFMQAPYSSSSGGSVFYAHDFGRPGDDDPIRNKTIYFLDNGSLPFELANVDGSQVRYLSPLAFDIESTDWALVAFLDQNNLPRLRIAHRNNSHLDRFGGETPLTLNPDEMDIRDIQIYHNNSTIPHHNNDIPANYGRALLLDTLNNKLWGISYNYAVIPALRVLTMDRSIDLGTNKSPQAFVLGPKKEKAFVVNAGDSTLTVISIKNNNGNPIDPATITEANGLMVHVPLRNFLPPENQNQTGIVPTTIQYVNSNTTEVTDDYLLVGATELKALIKINMQSLQTAIANTNAASSTKNSNTNNMKTSVSPNSLKATNKDSISNTSNSHTHSVSP